MVVNEKLRRKPYPANVVFVNFSTEIIMWNNNKNINEESWVDEHADTSMDIRDRFVCLFVCPSIHPSSRLAYNGKQQVGDNDHDNNK